MYSDARDRIRVRGVAAGLDASLTPTRAQEELGPLSYMVSFMSQPKKQLRTFAAWAGRSSDISYYLNSHHVDFLEVCRRTSCRALCAARDRMCAQPRPAGPADRRMHRSGRSGTGLRPSR